MMHSLNALLFVMVVTEHITLGEVRRNRDKSGPKTSASHAANYFKTKLRVRRQFLKKRGLCIECGTNPPRPGLTKCGDCELARKMR